MRSTDQRLWEAYQPPTQPVNEDHSSFGVTIKVSPEDFVRMLHSARPNQGKGQTRLPGDREYDANALEPVLSDKGFQAEFAKDAHEALMAYFGTHFIDFYEEWLSRHGLLDDDSEEPYSRNDQWTGGKDPMDAHRSSVEQDQLDRMG